MIRLFKITIAVFAILLLGIIGGLATTVMAAEPEDAVIIEMQNENTLNITPTGYRIGSNDEIAHTGKYILTGNMNTNITFANSTSTPVTYDVILHNFNATSKEWHGCLGIDNGVTLNLTVSGINYLLGHNHAGITGNESGEKSVNITVMENSSLKVGCQYSGTSYCIKGENLNLTLLEGTSSVEMTGDWTNTNRTVTFSNGSPVTHSHSFVKTEANECQFVCNGCSTLTEIVEHDVVVQQYGTDNESYTTHHNLACEKCGYTVSEEHDLSKAVPYDGETHNITCNGCGYVSSTVNHTLEGLQCTVCLAERMIKHIDGDGNEKYYVSFGDAIKYAMNNGGTLQLLKDYDANGEDIYCVNADYTFDFNGYTLTKSYLIIGGSNYKGTLTLIDSSEKKTGAIRNTSSGSVAYGGKIVINDISGITGISAYGGTVIFNGTKHNNLSIGAFGGSMGIGKIELNNVTVENELRLYDDTYTGENEDIGNHYKIKGGSFGEITLEDDYKYGYTLSALIADGYAYFVNESIANGNVLSLENVSVGEHTHDFENTVYNYDNENHWDVCVCGKGNENPVKEAHKIDANGQCEICKLQLAVKHTDSDGNNKYFINFSDGINYVAENGGTLQMLSNYEGERVGVQGNNTDFTFDFNGFTLYTAYFSINGATVTVIDTSEKKTGRMENCGYTNVIHSGSLIINDIFIDGGLSVYDGNAVLNNAKIELQLNALENATIELNNVTSNNARLDGEGTYIIKGGSFKKLYTYDGVSPLMPYLAEGYAYSVNGSIVNGNVASLENVSVVEHTHDFESETYNYDSENHWIICDCGKENENSVKEVHTADANGQCEICEYQYAASVTVDGTKEYFADINSAISDFVSRSKATLTLYTDVEINGFEIDNSGCELTIDLNGKELYTDILVNLCYGSTLIIEDSSESQNGRFTQEQGNYTAIGVYGKLIFNSGRFLSIIDVYGTENEIGEVIINGGSFEGAFVFCLYNNTNITVNGGIFSAEQFAYVYEDLTNVSIKLFGGIYENGLTINNSDYQGIYLKDCLPSGSECTVNFVNKNREIIELDDTQTEYASFMSVTHSKGVVNNDENGHRFNCSVCNVEYNSGVHSNFVYTLSQDDKTKHTVSCGICAYVTESVSHSGGNANCTELAECEYCEAEYGELKPDNHSGGKATCVNKAVCERCNTPYGKLDKDNHESKETKYVQNEQNSDEHNEIHVCCNEIIDTGKHKNGVTTCTEYAKCTVCELNYGEAPKGHIYEDNCDAFCDTCGERRETSGHTFDNACDTECNECKSTRENGHIYDLDGICISCGATTTPQPEPKKTMGTGAIIGIVIASLAVFGGGTFSLIWFVLRKKF